MSVELCSSLASLTCDLCKRKKRIKRIGVVNRVECFMIDASLHNHLDTEQIQRTLITSSRILFQNARTAVRQ